MPEFKKIVSKMERIQGSLDSCNRKIQSASKFLDYFVHDMLDYSILNNKEKNFSKDIRAFDIRSAITEILEIQGDKVHMKEIKLDLHFRGFPDDCYIVESDQKRIQ